MRGILLQRLPGAGPDDDVTWARAAAIARATPPADLFGAGGAEASLQRRFPDDDLRLFKPRTARFACSCSRERVANALRMIGRTEVESILAEQGQVGVTCEFCNRSYTFDAEDARRSSCSPQRRPTRCGTESRAANYTDGRASSRHISRRATGSRSRA